MKLAAVFMAVLFLLSGCVTLVEKGGHALDGSAFNEKVLASFREQPKKGVTVNQVRNKPGDEYITITVDSFPTLRFTGVLTGTGGRADGFSLLSCTFLSPNLFGWNEFTTELSGGGSFNIRPGAVSAAADFVLDRSVARGSITGGKIRRNSSRVTGAQALTALRNRQERITALTEWMHTQNPPEPFADQAAFAAYWEPVLLPEVVSAKKRPSDWTKAGAEWFRADDINWNGTYTAARFPEELHGVRNSGALLRDWEEALSWIYLDYEWDRLIAGLSNPITLTRR